MKIKLDLTLNIEEPWPLTCIFCGSTDLIYSEHKHDIICLECGRYQLEGLWI